MEEEIKKKLDEQMTVLVSIRRATRIGVIFNVLRFLLILIPLILAVVYLPSFIDDYSKSIQSSIFGEGEISLPQSFDLNDFQQFFERN